MDRDDPAIENVVELLPSEKGAAAASRLPREGLFWIFTAVLMLVTGLVKGIGLLVLLSYLLMGLLIVNGWIVRGQLRRLIGQRIEGGPIFARVPADLQVEVANDNHRLLRGVIVQERGSGSERCWMILRLQRGRPVRIRWRQIFAERGLVQIGPLTASSKFPFGLIGGWVELSPAVESVVLPRLGRIHDERLKDWLARATRGDGRMRRRKLQPATQEADIRGLRDYRPGDSPRWIHWRSSARRGQVLVREFEDHSAPDLILVVEPWLPPRPADADRARLEALVSLAATICKEWCRDSATRLTLIVSRPSPLILTASTGPEFALRTMKALAVEGGHPAVPSEKWLDQLPHASQSTPVLVLSSRAKSTLADEVSAYLGRAVAQAKAKEELSWYDEPEAVASSLV